MKGEVKRFGHKNTRIKDNTKVVDGSVVCNV